MNKLVQKNPVQRFKQGKKIVKAEGGFDFDKLRRIPQYYRKAGDYFNQAASLPADKFISKAYNKTKRTLFPPDKYSTAKVYKLLNKLTGEEPIGITENVTDQRKLPKNQFYKNGKLYQTNSDGTTTLLTIPAPTRGSQQVKDRKPTVITTSTPTYYVTRKYRGKIPVSGLNSRDAVKAYQRDVLKMGNASDGIWGDNTQKAYLAYLNRNGQGFKPGVDDNNTTTALLNTSTTTVPVTDKDIAQINPEYTLTYSQTPQFNVVGQSGTTYSNEQARDLFENITLRKPTYKYSTILFKQGGNLLSKNPVKRFKKGNIIKVQKGIKTAPKARDRYEGGRKQSTPNQNGDHVDIVTGQKPSMFTHAPVFSRIISPTGQDTTYVEVPEHTSFVDVKPRVVQNDWQENESGNIVYNNSPEFYIMKRRFNEALLSASRGKLTPLQPKPLRPIKYSR